MPPGENAIAEFVGSARRFCALVEGAASLSRGERVHRARDCLADLVLKAGRLPQGDADGPEVTDDGTVAPGWPGFEELDIYWEVFDPYENDEPVAGSLSDDMLDVYRDLRRGLRAYDAGQVGVAVWEWRFHFDQHWGDHAVDALRALQRACRRLGDQE